MRQEDQFQLIGASDSSFQGRFERLLVRWSGWASINEDP